jgi:hypothetical protein
VINRPPSRPWTHEDNNECGRWRSPGLLHMRLEPSFIAARKQFGRGLSGHGLTFEDQLFKTQPSRHEMTPSGPRWAALAQRCSDSTCDLAPNKAETLTPFYNSDVVAGLPAVD